MAHPAAVAGAERSQLVFDPWFRVLEAAAPEHQEAQAATALEALEAAAPEAQEAADQAVPVAPTAPSACARNTTSAPPSEAMRDSERC